MDQDHLAPQGLHGDGLIGVDPLGDRELRCRLPQLAGRIGTARYECKHRHHEQRRRGGEDTEVPVHGKGNTTRRSGIPETRRDRQPGAFAGG